MNSRTLGSLAAVAALVVLTSLLPVFRASNAEPAAATPASPSGAQLWADNCGNCHNLRSPSSLSDSQWEVVAMHMRVRANLTEQAHAEILAFLKSAH